MLNLNKKTLVNYLLLPFAGIFFLLSRLRVWLYALGVFKTYNFNTPVIVVGNITAGGSGKTPIVIALVEHFKQNGKKVGVVSRGYGGAHKKGSLLVDNNTPVGDSGDEPLLIAIETQVLVMVNKNRVQAVQDLIANYAIDVIISDDGLQHYAMGRRVEIAVINGRQRFGNGFFLPAGPLRELPSRLKSVDFIINNGGIHTDEFSSALVPKMFINLVTSQQQPLDFFHNQSCYGITGIGDPDGFFDILSDLGVQLIPRIFADHHIYTQNDLTFENDYPVIMTSKDCVKCSSFATKQMWYLYSQANLDEDFLQQLNSKL